MARPRVQDARTLSPRVPVSGPIYAQMSLLQEDVEPEGLPPGDQEPPSNGRGAYDRRG